MRQDQEMFYQNKMQGIVFMVYMHSFHFVMPSDLWVYFCANLQTTVNITNYDDMHTIRQTSKTANNSKEKSDYSTRTSSLLCSAFTTFLGIYKKLVKNVRFHCVQKYLATTHRSLAWDRTICKWVFYLHSCLISIMVWINLPKRKVVTYTVCTLGSCTVYTSNVQYGQRFPH